MLNRYFARSPLWLTVIMLVPVAGWGADFPNGRIEINGNYRYAQHHSETLAEAKSLACREAWRLAVLNSSLYREQTVSVIDSPLLRDLAYTLASRFVQDQQIVEQTEPKRIVSCGVRGFLPLEESRRVIRTQLSGDPPSSDAFDQNRALRILSVREEGSGSLIVQYQALKRLDWLGTHYQGGLRETADIMVAFYDHQDFLIKTDRYPARKTPSGDDTMNPSAVGVLKVVKPPEAKIYRVWLVK
ncbi:hypothetical protein [Candidatus Nitrospira neomarina]|uniref:Uncharacterized protein n=1 Tax=Candidatus Nitrospira neomarina TaxID=3020899 RepID=A0AA96GQT4_9BACT|nr:hypothetical protein [Candidatus Nitrospira neomarina]WNM62434.1 hypothetical protein PQG83_01435 [Candidatus Nitrospira neomarina]